jgi:hypothetical protein
MARKQQPTPPTPQRRNRQSPLTKGPGPIFYAIVALVAFLIGCSILGVMLWNAQLLVSLGLTGNFYYVLLLALGLSAAVFLFGLLQSHAVYRGDTGFGRLELGGAIVGCALVVWGGFYLVPNPLPFAVTVFVHGEGGIHDLVPKGSGEVVMELGPEVRRQEIGPNGTVDFTNIAPNYRGWEVPVWVDSKQLEPVHPDQKYPLNAPIQLEVRKKAGKLSGRVQDPNGKPLVGTKVEAAGLSATTDLAGRFELVIPGDRLQPSFDLVAETAGYSAKHYEAVPNANELVIVLVQEK